MKERRGRCTNFGNCTTADRREVVVIRPGLELTCPECKRQLTEIEQGSGGMNPLLAIGGVLVLLLLGGFAYWRMMHKTSGGESSILPPASGASSNVVLRLHGSNTIGAKLAPALAEAFLKSEGAQNVSTRQTAPDEYLVDAGGRAIEIQAHGSSTAFADLAAGKTDIGMASRKIKPEEAASLASLGDMTSPACEHVLGLDGLAIIVNRSKTLSSISKEDLAKIFSGEITDWKQLLTDGGTIKVYARDEKSGTYDTFKTLVLGDKKLLAGAVRVEDSRELSNKVANDPDAIGFVGLPFVQNAKALAVSEKGTRALLPTMLTVATEDYALSRRLYLYTAANPKNELVRRFVTFALSKAGQDVVAANGFVAQNVQAQSVSVESEAPPDYRRLTEGAERLSLDFRFRTGSSALDNKALDDLDRVTSFISDLHYSGKDVFLFGFADSTGSRDVNTRLSQNRAQAVADQFSQRGLTPATIRGFGSDPPVASNQTADGREKNRRVEIWIKKG